MTRSTGSPLDEAVRALRRRDHTAVSLDAHLGRRGVGSAERETAIERVRELGYLDDARFASRRAESLAARGYGDALVAADLARQGVSGEVAAAAVAALEPERQRAARLVARRGGGTRTGRYLAAKGFSEEVVLAYVAGTADGAVG